ncbi:unnamed protein product [Ascophyllum nodosum]
MSRSILLSASAATARRHSLILRRSSKAATRGAASSLLLLLRQRKESGSEWTLGLPALLSGTALACLHMDLRGYDGSTTIWMLPDDTALRLASRKLPSAESPQLEGPRNPAVPVRDKRDLAAKAKARIEATIRAGRLVWTAAVISADYIAYDVSKTLEKTMGSGDANSPTAEFDRLFQIMRNAQEEQKRNSIDANTLPSTKERDAARARSRDWHGKVLDVAKKIAEAEAAGVRAPKSNLHLRSAERLRKLCTRNGGVYVKLGQLLSQMDFVFPREYIEVLSSMLDQASRTPIEDVREVIKEELGQYPETLWRSFNPEPIASASLAQVHRAVGWNGEDLAVKVQHRGLKESSTGDVDTVCLVVSILDALFPTFSYKWLAEEVEQNMPDELNFLREASNSRKCAAMFEGRDDICVPPVVTEQTTERVLTMRFEPGLRATDVEGMRALGVSLPWVAALISEAFCEQVFRHGTVHCDPHGANVLVRRHPHGGKRSRRPQLVLLDHGLYRELTEQFRVDYCRLWKAMIFKDIPAIEHYCKRMNSGQMYHLLAAMLCSRSWDSISDKSSGMEGLHSKSVNADKSMVRGYVQQYAAEIVALIGKVDRQLLMLFKTNDCLRHIDRTLGAPINTFVIAAKTCIAVLREEDANQALARLGVDKRNFVVRNLLYALYFIRGIPEAIKVNLLLLGMGFQERLLTRRLQREQEQ